MGSRGLGFCEVAPEDGSKEVPVASIKRHAVTEPREHPRAAVSPKPSRDVDQAGVTLARFGQAALVVEWAGADAGGRGRELLEGPGAQRSVGSPIFHRRVW